MLSSIALDRVFNFFPALDFGKLWSFLKVKQPARPVSSLKRTSPIAWVMMGAREHSPMGFVFLSEDGARLIYAKYIDDEADDSRVEISQYIDRSPASFLNDVPKLWENNKKKNFAVLANDIRPLGGSVTSEDRAWVKRCFDPNNRVAFVENPTLG